MGRLTHHALTWFIACCAIITSACSGNSGNQLPTDAESSALRDTLIVGTLYSPTSYFLYKGDLMGYHFDLISQFAKDKNIQIEFKVMRNLASLVNMLDSAEIDIIAYNIPMTTEYKQKVTHCGFENITRQVLVQNISKTSPLINDVTQLIGKTITVEKDSKYEARLRNLNNELGGGIKINAIKKDTLMAEDLIDMVAEKEIALTVVDSDIAKLDHTYYDNIDVHLEISFPQKSAWAIKKEDTLLAKTINDWSKEKAVIDKEQRLYRHYFETSKISKAKVLDFKRLRHGKISEYDNLFKKYAKSVGWDWRLLAAQGYVESKFDPNATSWAGAKGLMQLMPGTAANYGLSIADINDPELNIKAAVKSIADLDKSLKRHIADSDERLKFILAAYNSGIAHIYDAIALAKKYDKNPEIWHRNVSEALLMKANPIYYNDDVCKYGYFRGKQTVAYVEEVIKIYDIFRQH